MRWAYLWTFLTAILLHSCSASAPPPPVDIPTEESEDHTIPRVASVKEFEKYSTPNPGTRELKFIIPYFEEAKHRHIRFLDANFYWFHDEWYWYGLLRGMSVPGERLVSRKDYGFESPGAATQWASAQEKLPLGLRMIDGRLYADRFYELALGKRPHTYGLGSVFHVPERSAPSPSREIWAFKIEYTDKVREKDLAVYFEMLRGALPQSVADKLVFVARSPEQHKLIAQLKEARHPLASRLKKYSDLVTPGALQVYSEGLTAGYLRIIDEENLVGFSSTPEDILLLPQIPDELPAAAGVITSVPQTPLSHINLLAQNRGIPNLYMGHAEKNVQLRQLAHDEMPVVMRAKGNSFVIEALDERVYKLWLKLTKRQLQSLPSVDPASLPYVRDLRKEDFRNVAQLRRSIGGKAAGYLALLAGGVDVPDPALALSTRAFSEHLEKLEPAITVALTHPEFQGSAHLRFLILEGPEAFRERFGAPIADPFVETFEKKHPVGPLADLVRRGGLRQALVDEPMDPKALAHITDRLKARFAPLLPSQGLRFRSSSNVEDIEGFNGAGLYESHTGFFDAADRTRAKDRVRTIEHAIKSTWASFYSFAAFEERSNEGINPLSGAMGVLVHPRFDDEHELANGVLTLRIDQRATEGSGRVPFELMVNVQKGSESVTNAESGVTPEAIRLRSRDGKKAAIQYLSESSGRPSDGRALTEPLLEALLRDAVAVGREWLARENEGLPELRRRSGVVLDFEFRYMAAAWPARREGPGTKSRMLLKQVRPLEPSPPDVSEEAKDGPWPGELLARATRLDRLTCGNKKITLEALRLWTDPAASHDFGFAEEPFVAEITVYPTDLLARWGPEPVSFSHPELSQAGTPRPPARELQVTIARRGAPVRALAVAGADLTVTDREGSKITQQVKCTKKALLDHPDRLLREALEGR